MTATNTNGLRVKLPGPAPAVPAIGFSIPDPMHWYTCRMQFAKVFSDDTNEMFFHHPKVSFETVGKFIKKIEDILDLGSKKSHPTCLPYDPPLTNLLYYPTQVLPTDNIGISYVRISNFWYSCPIRRSLFTILLRCSVSYKPETDNFEATLMANNYLKLTEVALTRFLLGFTHFIGEINKDDPGWLTVFSGKQDDFVKKVLVRPPCEIGEKFRYFNSIWT